jgi:glucose-1-phosphatase
MRVNLENFEAIIFDLGGVLLNIDYHKTSKAFSELGVADFDTAFSQAKQQRLFDDYETGKISSEEFLEKVLNWCRQGTSSELAEAAWNAMLLDFPNERLDVLKRLSSSHRLFLLSNTNEIHIRAYKQYLKKTFGFSCLKDFFEKQYYSYEIGMRKPDEAIFFHVLQENNLKPERTLFIDDSIQHIHGASSTGINAIHLPAGNTILDLFSVMNQ